VKVNPPIQVRPPTQVSRTGSRQGFGIRTDAVAGHCREDGIRYLQGAKPDKEPDPHHGESARALFDPMRPPPGPCLQGIRAGGRCDADLVFPARWDCAVEANLEQLYPAIGADEWINIEVPPWEELAASDSHAVAARRVVRIWQRLSRWLIRRGCRWVTLNAPLDDRFLTTGGLFGHPTSGGDPGDAHWRLSTSPHVSGSGADGRITWGLRRSADPREARTRWFIRNESSHIIVFPHRKGRMFMGAVLGFAAEGHSRKPLPLLCGPRRRNATTAVAEALARALRQYPLTPDITVWTNNDLLISAVNGQYKGKTKAPYRGVKPPEMDEALSRARRAVRRRAGRVTVKQARRGGSVALEIVGIHVGLHLHSEDSWLGQEARMNDLESALRGVIGYAD